MADATGERVPLPVARSAAGSARAESRRRPHDRKQRILSAAAALFWSRGYHQVGMADIAASVGITAGALYRHVHGKRELLAAVLSEALGDLVTASEPRDLGDMVDRLVVRGLERREFTALWEREKRELATMDREEIGRRIRAIQARIVTDLKRSHPQESPDQLDLRASAILAVAESPSYQPVELGTHRMHDLLCS
ncbi:MAG: TetR/AcrR family transcriptional regulator, partial [Sciscionella sp.]